MKKYFTKYLPVEGDVIPGDYWSSTTGMFHLVRDQEHADKINKRRLETPQNSWYSKGKLFLCSRDIQVGDEYYNEQFEFTKYPNKSIADSSTEMVGENGSYKVIGEISPDAVWVKEGDKFDEDEVKESYIITNDKRSSSYNLHWYRIKCPTCRTYH